MSADSVAPTIDVQGNEPAITVHVVEELTSLADLGPVTIEVLSECVFEMRITVQTKEGPRTAQAGIVPDTHDNIVHPLVHCIHQLRDLWQK